MTKRYLNIGCGSTFHPAWVNLDVEPLSPLVQRLDIRKGLFFPEGSFDACYSSHVIEHLKRNDAEYFLKEMYRVIKSGGFIRLATPDLEDIVQTYLSVLDKVLKGDGKAEPEYDWLMLELFDQTVRFSRGGDMGRYLQEVPDQHRPFIFSRIGSEALNCWERKSEKRSCGLPDKLTAKRPSWYLDRIRKMLAEKLVRVIAGREAANSFTEGLFRNSGEVHQWMYDRYSLKRLMEHAGFIEVRRCTAFESRINDFDRYQLDVVGGAVRKPDSLFMEGMKA